MTYHSFFLIAQAKQMTGWHIHHCLAAPFQCAKKVVSEPMASGFCYRASEVCF